jgi:hypothetical protein
LSPITRQKIKGCLARRKGKETPLPADLQPDEAYANGRKEHRPVLPS